MPSVEGPRAKLSRCARSNSPTSRTSIGVTSILNDGAAPWRDGCNCPMRAECSRVAKHRRARHVGRDLLEQLQPFTGDAIFDRHEPGDVPARPGQTRHQAGTDRVDNFS